MLTTLQIIAAIVMSICVLAIVIIGAVMLSRRLSKKDKLESFDGKIDHLLEKIKKLEKAFANEETTIAHATEQKKAIASDLVCTIDEVVEILEAQLGDVSGFKKEAKKWQAIAKKGGDSR